MTDQVRDYNTSDIPKANIGQVADQLTNVVRNSRRNFERRWYDNNFFYDGYHFRYFSRSQNKIVDLGDRQAGSTPFRAIPKTSLQIDGITNLMISKDFVPIVYPKKIDSTAFGGNEEMYKQALEDAKQIAKKNGFFVTEEFKNQDIDIKIPEMVTNAAKHFVSFMEIWPDYNEEKICTKVYDAFDIMLLGEYTELEDVPFIIKITPWLIAKIKAHPMFNKEQVAKINPDNKHASSEIKDAYMRVRYGREVNADETATVLLKECFFKEYLNSDNRARISIQKNAKDILGDRKEGDIVIRHVFAAGNIWLFDEYLTMKTYPFVDYRGRPGPLYQVPPIERFIPANKSLDVAVSRIERFFNTMVGGAWLKRQGEQFNISNEAGGQIIEYKTTPPVQADIKSPGGFAFNFFGFMSSLIEEQGLSTSTLGKLPKGVKANAAIESLKESEYSSLIVPTKMLKKTIQRIGEKFIEIADEYFIHPQTVYHTDHGQPSYFDIMGKSAMDRRTSVDVPAPQGMVPIDKELKVEIDVQSGLAYTREGQKQAAKELGDYLIQLAQLNMVSPEVVKVYLQQLLNVYQFGATGDIMEEVEKAMKTGGVSEPQLNAIKTAVMEVFSDLVKNKILPDSEQRIQEVKVGTAEVIKDANQLNETAATNQEMQLKQAEHDQKMAEDAQKAKIEELKAITEMRLKEKAANQEIQNKEEEHNQKLRLDEKAAEVKAKVAVKTANIKANATNTGK